jgi:hypothetical protein
LISHGSWNVAFSRMVRVHLAKAEGMFKNDILEQDFPLRL